MNSKDKNKFVPSTYEAKWPRKKLKLLRGKQAFNPMSFEGKWQQFWEKERIYQPDLKKAEKPFYNLMMFPYPSAEGLHVGNMYAFTGADIFGRFKRMQGHDVFEPIGLDGFGIHSENYALKVGKHPSKQAKISAKNFYRQLHAIGNGFAWENTLETYDPDYYRWTQWIFVKMFKKGLAYRKKSLINFCPSCKTVLSDEQVIDGHCERCKTLVEKREMEQWFFRITDYAEKLLQNTYQESFKWSEKVKIGQRNWIGKKEGINITYPIVSNTSEVLRSNSSDGELTITCFTTRPDTNYGATFLVIGPEHPFATSLHKEEIKNYVKKAKNTSEMDRIAQGREKTGVFSGFYALNQLNDYKMPIYISDFVLGHVGTGAVVGVPGHDLRDFEFARKFNIPVIRVVVGADGDTSPITKPEQVQEEEGKMVNSEFLDGKDIHTATKLMMDYLEEKGWGKRVTTYKLRDWCISRQRYWGAPIPMIFCTKCKWQAVHEKDLPVLLPALSDWKPEGTGKGPLAKVTDFVNVACPECGSAARRETDVCDTFLDSSWYFLRYPSVKRKVIPSEVEGSLSLSEIEDSHSREIPPRASLGRNDNDLPWDQEITKKWLPVNQYTGGAEHTVLHLLYARFVTMAFKDMGLLDFEEPFSRFYAHGLIIAEGAKMSKSRGNIVVPDIYIDKYGADALRAYLMFLGPFDQGGDFRDTGIAGMHRFLGRVWRLVNSFSSQTFTVNGELTKIMHKTIKEVGEDMENFRFNTAIAHIMEYVNALSDNPKHISADQIKTLLLLLAPFAPHMTEELWQKIFAQNKSEFESIHLHPWPVFDPQYLVEEELTIIIQINGKTRDTVKIPAEKAKVQKEVEVAASKSEKAQKFLTSKNIIKTIFVPGKLINFVVPAG